MDALVERVLGEVAGCTDQDQRERMMRESGEMLGAHFMRNAPDLEELAFQLFEIGWSDVMDNDILPQVIDVKKVGLGEVDFVDEDLRGLNAYWQGKGGQILSDIIRYERTQMPREEMVAAIDLHRDEIALEFWNSYSRLQAQAEEKLRQLPIYRLIELVQAGITSGPTFAEAPASTLTSANIDPVIDFVAQRSKGKVTILGARNAIRILSNVGVQFGYNVAERIFDAGQVGTYKGYPLVEVENFENFAGNLVMPVNELWVIGQNCGRLTYFGDQPKVQQLARPGFYVRWETARDAGMLLYGIGRGRLGRLKFT